MLHRPTMKPDSFLGLCTTLCLWRVLSPYWGEKSELPLFELSNTFCSAVFTLSTFDTVYISLARWLVGSFARSLVRSLETSNMFMRMWGWVSSLCFRILTVNNTNPDILFATEFILIQMTATVTVLLLFIPKASFFLIHRTCRNLKHQHWPILTLEDFFRVHIDSYKRGGGLGEFERARRGFANLRYMFPQLKRILPAQLPSV